MDKIIRLADVVVSRGQRLRADETVTATTFTLRYTAIRKGGRA